MKRVYFHTVKLRNGEYVNVVYESEHRKNTRNHWFDYYYAVLGKADVDWAYKYNKNTAEWSFVLNEKNKEEMCFDDYRAIDVRSK